MLACSRRRSRALLPAAWSAAVIMLIGLAVPATADEAVLVVTGRVGTGTVDGRGEVSLTRDDLRAMGGSELRTGTPWTDGVSTFTGVTGRRFVEALQASGVEVAGTAINDYHTVIPFEVFDSDTLFIAYARDGAPMPVREKGPLWVIFPFDADDLYRSDTYRAYAIWSLNRLEFR